MGLTNTLRKVVKNVEEKLQKFFSSKDSHRKPLIIQRDILDKIEERVELKDRARSVFPFDHLEIHVLATTEEQRAALEAVLIDGDTLVERIKDRLRQYDVIIPDALNVEIKLVETSEPNWEDRFFHVNFHKRKGGLQQRTPVQAESAEFVILSGKATRRRYNLNQSLFNIGRLTEVTDEHGRPLRRNHLAFIEDGKDLEPAEREINRTVGREHAHVRFDDQAGAFRLYVDRGDNGTRIFRGGEMTKVEQTNLKGKKLQHGDIIYFGKASVRFDLKQAHLQPSAQNNPVSSSATSNAQDTQKKEKTTRPT